MIWILQILVILALMIIRVFFLNDITYILRQFANFQEKHFV
jgi:hypothetical protein